MSGNDTRPSKSSTAIPDAHDEVERVKEILRRHAHPMVFTQGWPLQMDSVLDAIAEALATRPLPPAVKSPSDLEKWQQSIDHLTGADRIAAIDRRFGSVSDADD